MYMLYTLLRQFAKIFLLAIPSVRDAHMRLRLRGCAWVWYRFICLYLFGVEENLWPRCSCFRHASIANSQTPGRLELVGFQSILGPTQNFSWFRLMKRPAYQLSVLTAPSFSFIWCNSPHWAGASSFTRFLDHTRRHTTVDRTPLDEWSARRRDLYLTTQHSRQTSMPPVGFKPTIWAGERPQTYALAHSTTGTGSFLLVYINWINWNLQFSVWFLEAPAKIRAAVFGHIQSNESTSIDHTLRVDTSRYVERFVHCNLWVGLCASRQSI